MFVLALLLQCATQLLLIVAQRLVTKIINCKYKAAPVLSSTIG